MHKAMLVRKLKKHERSQRWLSRKLDISAMAVSKWCNGLMPIPDKRAKQIKRWLP
tara:strand:+ start:1315 stop:1479 length:165 start_codon:yes stop_codon:yes gene_type:complete